VTSVFVTHDQDEALEIADRIVVMNKGRIEQIGTPEEVYEHPATPFVYDFLGGVRIGLREKNGKFITANTGHDIHFSYA
jgi:sulfate transport system ATP-binding protein